MPQPILSAFLLSILLTLLPQTLSTITGDERFDLGIKHSQRWDRKGNEVGTDDFCKNVCWSRKQCDEVFPTNFIDLAVKIDYSKWKGPGQHLIFNVNLGDTIARQSFDTQFVLDVSTSLNVSACQLYVDDVSSGSNHHSWKSNNVIVSFRFFPANVVKVMELTRQVSDPDSMLYEGSVTRLIDPLYSVTSYRWDASLKLMYNIDIIDTPTLNSSEFNTYEGKGGPVPYLNEGAERYCDDSHRMATTPYCEFEWFFLDDVSRALEIPFEQLQILFIKPFGRDSVLVDFRFVPEFVSSVDPLTGDSNVDIDASWLADRMFDLQQQVNDLNSTLYKGNVTLRTDVTWGLSNNYKAPRKTQPYMGYSFQPTASSPYERCKATHRCARGWEYYRQGDKTSNFTSQHFGGGEHGEAMLVAGFEDWRKGTSGFRQGETPPPGLGEATRYDGQPQNAYFDPFNFTSLGPTVPSYNSSSNNGLVVNNASLSTQISLQ